MLTALKRFVPSSWKERAREIHKPIAFWMAIRRFLRDPSCCATSTSPVLAALVYGWNNYDWSAKEEYLAACIGHALRTDGDTIECGSGLSTLLLGAIADRRGKRHIAIEHQEKWAVIIRSLLQRYKIRTSVVILAPLKSYGEFDWYDVPLDALPERFDLIICDGPPGSTKGGRYGMLPILGNRLRGAVIMLDDAIRAEERSVARRWETETGASFAMHGEKKPYIEMRVPV